MALELSRVRGLCFGVDGTIADTDDHIVAQLAALIDRVPGVSGRRSERVSRQVVMGMETPVHGAYALLDRLGLDTPVTRLRRLFQAVVGAQTTRRMKPHPEPLIFAAERMGVSPGECLMIGDTTIDVRAGTAAGAQTVGVLCGFGTEDELRAAGAGLILHTTSDLLGVLDPKEDPLGQTASPKPASPPHEDG